MLKPPRLPWKISLSKLNLFFLIAYRRKVKGIYIALVSFLQMTKVNDDDSEIRWKNIMFNHLIATDCCRSLSILNTTEHG